MKEKLMMIGKDNKGEKHKKYEIEYLISKYYDKHIQELEESINKKDELIKKI